MEGLAGGGKTFDWFEYLVFVVMLLLSTLIGLFFCCYHGGQNTVSGYLLGNKQMSVIPIAMSLIASSISGVTLLGIPSEIYRYGSQFFAANLANLGVGLITLFVFLPVFYKLQFICLYEYLEARFNRPVRLLASSLFAISWFLFMPIVIYGPALAFNQVSGLSIYIVSPIVCAVCIFYTTFGGLKAVVWADALQGAVMMGSIVAVAIMGVNRVGGLSNVLHIAKQGGRLEIFNMSLDPRERLTFWSSTVGLTFQWLAFTATSPAAMQRFIALPSYKQAKTSTLFLMLGWCTFNILSVLMGLIIYANYHECDPLTTKSIRKPDQILPHFVLDIAGDQVKGLSGLFVAGIVCAALSTMSTGMNTLSGTFYEDFIEPIMGKQSERRASNIMKALSVIIGIICTVLVHMVERLGSIIEMTSSFGGVTSGSTLGIFTLGILFPPANSKGAIAGGLTSMVVMLWAMIGKLTTDLPDLNLPVSIEGCPANSSYLPSNSTAVDVGEVFPLYRLTAFLYGLTGFLIVIVVGVIVSYMTGPTDPATIDPELISPIVRSFLPPPRDYASVPMDEKTIEVRRNSELEKTTEVRQNSEHENKHEHLIERLNAKRNSDASNHSHKEKRNSDIGTA